MHITVPHHLMPYQLLYVEPIFFQLLPSLMLSYESWRLKKPQILWPPLISVSYCMSLEMGLWFSFYVILCLLLSFRTGIDRIKCVIISFILLTMVIFSNQETTFLRGIEKQPKDLLNWNDYHHLCLETGETAWLQRPEQQLQCSKFIGLPIGKSKFYFMILPKDGSCLKVS